MKIQMRQTLQQDFFNSPKSKKAQLLEFIRTVHYAPTSNIIKWGCEHFLNRAERTARELAKEGKIRRMSFEEKIVSRFANRKEDVWVYCG